MEIVYILFIPFETAVGNVHVALSLMLVSVLTTIPLIACSIFIFVLLSLARSEITDLVLKLQ